MCGIGGFWGASSREESHAILATMDRLLRHRGPDEGGRHLEKGVALLIRRLKVIDLVTGSQPMASETGQIITVFNGEIYNHQDLRSGLVARGHTFKSQSDTEVIVHLFEEEGIQFLHKLRGMFAIAVWDRGSQTLYLARDRLGIKPLYYADCGGRVLFASEIRPLLACMDDDAVDWNALGAYFQLGYVPAPMTCYQHIRLLPPGSYLKIGSGGLTQKRWWRLEECLQEPPRSLEAARQRLRELVEESVRLRLLSDVPLGAFLSGGMDSTLVVGTMARLLDRPVETFTIGFDDPLYDETAASRLAAGKFRTHAHEQVAGSDSLQVLESLLDRFGQPFADPSAVPTLLVSRLARRHVTVSLSGDGGDELFGGYTRYRVASVQQWYDRIPKTLRTGVARAWPRGMRGAGLLDIAAQDFSDRYFGNMSLFSQRERHDLLAGSLQASSSARPLDHAEDLVRNTHGQMRQVQDLLLLDLHSYLPDVILTKVDRMSMDCSLEARVPLLDHALVEFVFSLPPAWRMGPVGTKGLLRDAFDDLYPAEILQRKKMGFGIPLGRWLAGSFKDQLLDLPRSASVREGLFQEAAVRGLVQEHLAGRRDRGRKLWALLIFDGWWSNRHRSAGIPAEPQIRL